MKIVVYKIVNNVNSKVYVGQTRNGLSHRKDAHLHRCRSGLNRPLYNAMRKYGVDNFTWSVLEVVEHVHELDAAETKWIATLGCMHPSGYNLMAVGNNGFEYSELALANMARSRENRQPCSETTKAKISTALKARYKAEGFCKERASKIAATLRNKNPNNALPTPKKVRKLKKAKLPRPTIVFVCEHPTLGAFQYSKLQDFCREHTIAQTTASRWSRTTCGTGAREWRIIRLCDGAKVSKIKTQRDKQCKIICEHVLLGKHEYTSIVDFCKQHNIPIRTASRWRNKRPYVAPSGWEIREEYNT